jgi:hypothetical protein
MGWKIQSPQNSKWDGKSNPRKTQNGMENPIPAKLKMGWKIQSPAKLKMGWRIQSPAKLSKRWNPGHQDRLNQLVSQPRVNKHKD